MIIPRGAILTDPRHLELLVQGNWDDLDALLRVKKYCQLLGQSNLPGAEQGQVLWNRVYLRALQLQRKGIAAFFP